MKWKYDKESCVWWFGPYSIQETIDGFEIFEAGEWRATICDLPLAKEFGELLING